ncbi:MAG TPA: S41 family peptidase [Thermoanaerobaculia bacterium]|nr:S41 family peptidase [Thermoanaerobaculia bacterium]
MPKSRLVPFALAAALLVPAAGAAGQTKLLRFPDVHQDRVVFTYAGDLWLAPADGGMARRLTAHPGLELFAKFSPDGRWIAFTGQYDGDEQVYVMPAEGGVPRQLTFYPAAGPLPPRWGHDDLVYGWTPDGEGIVFRSLRYGYDIGEGRLFVVSPDGGLPEPLPMPTAGAGDLSPDGERIAYSPLFRDFRSWKRYAGGWAQDLYVFDLDSYETVQLTNHPRTDRDPMWIGDTIYFASDRTGTLNLFATDAAGGEPRQVTDSTVWDLRWPSAGPGPAGAAARIVYEMNGELHLLDTADDRSRPIRIDVPSDLLAARSHRMEVSDFIEDFALSPKGERAVIVARGDVFTVPIEHGAARNLTHSSDAHDKWARWSPDGSRIAYLSDADGEDELYVVDQDGGEPVQLTGDGTMFRYAPEWSADGERIAFSDKEGRLWVVDVDRRTSRQVADDQWGQLNDWSWSPDGRFIAMNLTDDSGFGSIWIWSAADGELRRVTDDLWNEFNPVWDADGEYLYYFADRSFAPQIGSFEWNYVVDRETYLVAMALTEDTPHPFPPRSDEVTVEDDEREDDEQEGPDPTQPTPKEPPTPQEPGAEGGSDAAETPDADDEDADEDEDEDDEDGDDGLPEVEIDWEGLSGRVARVPLEADNYGGLSAKKGHLLYARTGAFYYGRQGDVQPSLHIFSLEDREAKVLAENIQGYTLSADGSKVLVRHGGGGGFALYDATTGGKDSRKPVSTAGLAATVDPRQEWAQIFDEVWRRFRDFFYVANMHGYDWERLRDRYRPWLEHVAHRSDLNYLISEMISELNVSHAYIAGGDFEIPPRPEVALPGARFELDRRAGRYRIAEIYRGHNEEPKYRAPLDSIGVEVDEGDYVLAIDGEPLEAGDNPYQLLLHKADRPVALTVNERPTTEGAREITFEPVTSEDDLLYLDFVLDNRARVERMTGGRVGYLHVPDMGADGIYEWIKWFYPQIRKEGLIVDVRSNGGGNVSQMLIERLQRDLLATGFARTSEEATTYPATVFHGHLAALLNETSASDGDIFPAMFKAAGLGPLIGKRSWGGVIGITNRGPLVDGGSVNVPEFGFASPEGEWIIEGRGVEPDIVVENDPKSLLEGRDPQLERAVAEVLRAIEADPRRLPERPAPPVRTP